jgi:hypothetical protein
MTEPRDDFAAADSDSSAQSKNEVGSLQRGLAILHCIATLVVDGGMTLYPGFRGAG